MRIRLQFFHNARLVSAQYSLAYVAQSMYSLVIRRLSSVAIVLVVIFIAAGMYWLVSQKNQQFDWTQTQRNTLSQNSIAVLAEVEGTLSVTAYARETNTVVRKAIIQLIERYRRYKSDIDLSFVDPDAEPQLIRDLHIDIDGEMVLALGKTKEHVKSLREQVFSSGLQRLLRQGDRWLVFITGHGERKSGGKANHDLAVLVGELKTQGFNIANANLSATAGVPNNAAMVIIASSQVNWLPGEIDHIIKYIDGGGNLLWLTEPGEEVGLTKLAEHLAINIDGATVVDPLARLVGIDNPTFSIVANYPDHPLWKKFEATTLFPQITAVTANAESKGWQHDIVLSSGDHSWLERGDLSGNVRLGNDDVPGPVSIAVALQRQVIKETAAEKQQRIVIIGDGDFISNQYIGNAGNLGLSLRLINWLSADDKLIAIPTVERGDRELTLSLFRSQLIAIGFLIVVPAGLLFAGMGIWWRRRASQAN